MPETLATLTNLRNQLLDTVAPSAIRSFDNQISSIPGIIKLTLGEPDFNVPEHVKAAAIKSIEENDSHYAPASGKPELRQAISDYLKDSRGVTYNPADEVLVTVGATESLASITYGLLNPGDKVLVPTPAFSLYFALIKMAGAEPVMIDTSSDGFQLTAKRLENEIEAAGDQVKAVLLNYPNNPTGRTFTKTELEDLAAVLKKHELLVIADEIYSDLTYDQDHYSLATLLPEQTLLVSGLSKSHAMTGYRMGYVAGPAGIMRSVAQIHSYLVVCVNDATQAAAVEALNNGREDPLVFKKAYKKRRDYIIEKMTKMGFQIATPQGAFYVFAKIPDQFGKDDFKFALDVAEQAQVGLIPGSVFGAGSDGYVRLSYAASDDNIKVAMERLATYMEKF
ncbi:aminotransferase class I/II-fold pyridoxal phosphate-dependent enzyme [Limosilactobacillus gastricus]|uniref:Aminotransferase n=1 Tax=Limosilactobacillus gastricus DSM 16045 TaxID=1423749 RepID=A0A0R1VD24_9LACO|nr:aminotransferase class I/II-fold pyridoxal phosphate-dependent enzyme [Limosilactobacillus gastricus]KRM01161.1 Amino acid aminotransferase [Limosilactobacillus gastricus DSM 16045]QGF40466.1 aminotransferase class I/II-fold pyridoxal phosphate-dependent enzyme [Limosilactobacillus gastricus]